MSYPPTYPPSSNYAPGNFAPPPQRPTAMTVAAVMGIVLASLSLICNIIGVFGVIVQTAGSGQPASMRMSSLVMGISVASIVVSLILAITWLAVSIGLLKMAPWAVALAKKLALIHIGLLVLTLAVSLIVIAPETKKMAEAQFEEQQRQNPNGPPPPAGFAKGFAAGMAYGGPLIGFVLGMILPTTMLIALGRPSVKAAMASDTSGATGSYPGGM